MAGVTAMSTWRGLPFRPAGAASGAGTYRTPAAQGPRGKSATRTVGLLLYGGWRPRAVGCTQAL